MIAQISALVGCAPASDLVTGLAQREESAEMLAAAYHLDGGDRLRITVFQPVDLSGEFVLDGRANLAFPLIGEVSQLGSYA